MNSAIFVWTSDDARLPANLLSGFLFTDSCLIVGNTGLEQYLKNNPSESLVSCRDGKFAIALADGDKVRVFSDCFGLEPLFYFHDGVKWAVSNSLLALERSLSKMGVCLSFYRPSLEWFSMEGQGLFSGQPISNNTVISGVRLLPLGQEIVLDRQAGLRIESVDQEHLGSVVIGDYQNAIDKFLQSATARMLTLAKLAEPNCFVDLSGGQDSRLVFGIVAKYPHLAELTFARSNKSMEDDYRVAAAVASEYDFRLKSASYTGPKLGGQASFDLWADANAGLYRPIYVPVSDHPRAVVQFNGANFLGKAYVSKNVEERVESWRGSLSPEAFKIVADEFKNSFTDIGVCADSEEAMAQHYMHFRARIHYGRAWYSHFFGEITHR